MSRFRIRIYRRWTWESAVPASEIRLGGHNPIKLVAHDELQYADQVDIEGDNLPFWKPVQIVEEPKPESPQDAEDRERRERRTAEFAKFVKGIPPVDHGPQAGDTLMTSHPASDKALKDRVNVDRSKQQLTDGSPVPADRSHTQDRGDGQQKGYIVLSAEERAKGFVRPVRRSYIHVGGGGRVDDPINPAKSGVKAPGCGTLTSMGLALAETYARDPSFYSGTFCCGCHKHFPLDQFVWDGTQEQVGS